METAELDVALEELETRLERLRSLYEQYFMGIERIEPSIARKDVDRRIYVLRREKIRNTAKRFKLQTIIQRYNTFQQYWQRICREIENGTYKRHLLKVQKSGELLTIAARRRLGRQARTSQPPDAATPSQPPEAKAPSAPPVLAPSPPVPVLPVAAGSPPVPVSLLGGLPRRPQPPAPSPAAPAATAAPMPPTPAPGSPVAPAAPPAALAARAPAAPIAAPTPSPLAAKRSPSPGKFENLDLDMDFMGDWDPGVAGGQAPRPAPAKPPAAAAPPASLPAPAAPAARPLAPRIAPAKPAAPKPAAAPPEPVAPAQAKPAAPPLPPAPTPAPAPRPAPAAAAAAAPRPAAAAAPRPAAAPAPKPAPAAAAASANVDDARMRDLHARLQQAKQQTKEANVSFEGLAKSIRAAEAKLREQHKNRKIDFDVVIKDGKAMVKPIVR